MRTRRSIYKSPPQSKKEAAEAKEAIDELEDKENFVIDSKPNEKEDINDQNDEESSDEDSEFVIDNEPSKVTEIQAEESDSQSVSEEAKEESSDDDQEEPIEANAEFIIDNEPSKITEIQAEESESEPEEPKEMSSKKRKKVKESKGRKYPKYNAEIEKSMEKFLFGKVSSIVKPSISSSSSDEEEDQVKTHPQWSAIGSKASDSDSDSEDPDSKSNKDPKAAWHDEDDDVVQVKDVTATFQKAKGKHGRKETSTDNYALSLRKQFTNLMDRPKWADLAALQNDAEDSDDEFFRQTTDTLNAKKSLNLKKGFLDYRKLQDMNYCTHNEGSIIKSAEFHPKNAIGLVAGINGTASLFQIDGKSNAKLKSLHFENFPIQSASFMSDGRSFIAGSKHFGHFYAYDMVKDQSYKVPWKDVNDKQFSMENFKVNPVNDLIAFRGRFGAIHLFSGRSRSKLFSLQMNDGVKALTWSPSGDFLLSSGIGGQVYIWDVKAQECIHKFVDDGCITGTALAMAPNNRWLATGSNSGVVNVYKRSEVWSQTRPKPEKIVLNLTTSVSDLKFNPSSEILALASDVKDNAVKMLHVPSMTVFANFPSFSSNFHRANCMDFSLNGGYFSLGNNRGVANLYKLKHYGTY